MMLAIVFGVVLVLLLIIGDWYQFTNLRPMCARYGCGIATRRERLAGARMSHIEKLVDQQGFLKLPHGIARVFFEEQFIVIRPYYQLFAMRFRTAWPLKGVISIKADGSGLQVTLVKRVPWSSAIVTGLWGGLVVVGTLVFVVSFALDGGFSSLGGVMLGVGVFCLGLLVLVFGLIMVSLAYRLEDSRLMQVFQEFQQAVTPQPQAVADSSP